MTTSIIISGQVKGNLELKNAIVTNDCIVNDLPFNGFKLVFSTAEKAQDALKNAYEVLSSEEEEGSTNVAYAEATQKLTYDASAAVISEA